MQRNFTDTNGKQWFPKLTLFEAARIKRNLEINIEDFEDIQRMVQDPFLLCETLFIVCETEANRLGISQEVFGRSLAGDSIREAREALLYAVSDFFEDKRKRTAFIEVIESLNEEGEATLSLIAESTEAAKQTIKKQGAEYRKNLKKQLENPTSGEESGDAPESSEESTPTG